jgi:peroxiredoxin
MKFANMYLVSAFSVVLVLAVLPPVFAIEVGDKAPDFELPSTQGGKLKLSSFQGKKNVLIEFYVLDFTAT